MTFQATSVTPLSVADLPHRCGPDVLEQCLVSTLVGIKPVVAECNEPVKRNSEEDIWQSRSSNRSVAIRKFIS